MITYLSYVGATLLITSLVFFSVYVVGTAGDKIEEYFGGDRGEFAKLVYYIFLSAVGVGSFIYWVDYVGGAL